MFTTQILNAQMVTRGVYVGDLSSKQTTVLIVTGVVALLGVVGLLLSELRGDIVSGGTKMLPISIVLLFASLVIGIGYFAYSDSVMLSRVNVGYGVVNTINSLPGEGSTKTIDTVVLNSGFVKHEVIVTQQGGVVTLSYIDPASVDGKLIHIPLSNS